MLAMAPSSSGTSGKRKDAARHLKERALYWVTSPVRFFKALCFSVGFVVVSTGLGACGYAAWVYSTLPDIKHMDFSELKARGQKSVQRRLEDKSKFNPRWLEIKEVHRDYLYTIVLSEDSGFFEHEGIEVDAMLASMAENLKHKKYEYGASTISQQVVKNVFLSSEKSIVRKLKEIFLTEQLERRFNKNQILELYFNIAEFGPDLFGADAAARHFFAKAPAQINAAEGAFIAQMLPSPRRNYYAMFENQNLPAAKRRRIRRVLGDMLGNEFISAKQYKDYTHYPYERKFSKAIRRPRK